MSNVEATAWKVPSMSLWLYDGLLNCISKLQALVWVGPSQETPIRQAVLDQSAFASDIQADHRSIEQHQRTVLHSI